MSLSKIIKNYANSFLDVNIKKDVYNDIADEILFLINSIETSDTLKRLCSNPVIRPELKKAIFRELFTSRVSNNLMSFVELIIENNRTDLLIEILKNVLKLKDNRDGFTRVEVRIPFELEQEQINHIIAKLESILGNKVILNLKIDKSVIGGFIARYDDIILDASLRHQLNNIRKQFIQTSITFN